MKSLTVLCVVLASASLAFGYTGASVSVFEADVSTPNLTVFPVPAAAGMAGAQLLYDNSALLNFSPGTLGTQRNWLSLPLVSAGVTVNNIAVIQSGPVSKPFGVNNSLGVVNGQYYTNIQEAAADPRFPSNIPRPGRDCSASFSAFQFNLTQAAPEVGVFIANASNSWSYVDWNTGGRVDGTWLGDDNNVKFTNKVFVAVLGPSDTFATAEVVALDIVDGYAPFIKVTGNGTDLIKSICVYQDASWQGAPSFGFFDVYATPEPVSLALLAMGLAGVIRRRR